MAAANDFVHENIPPACLQISRKVDILSTVSVVQCLSPNLVSSIKKKLFTEINDLKQLIETEQDHLKIIKDDLISFKENIAMIEEWEDGFRKLDSVLPVVNKPANPVVRNAHQPLGGLACNQVGTNKGSIPTFRHIEETEWNTVPSYLKLRLKLEQVNDFVQVLNRELSEKYTLLKKKKSELKKSELTLRGSYVEMETADTKGLYFVVASDLKKMRISEKMISNMSSILRHCRRLRELRTGKIVRLIVTNQ